MGALGTFSAGGTLTATAAGVLPAWSGGGSGHSGHSGHRHHHGHH